MNYASLVKAIQSATSQLQGQVAVVANQALVLRNWLVGAYLVEFEQHGKERAKYGTRLLEKLAEDLKAKGLKGLGLSTLRDCRTFSILYPEIRQPAVGEFGGGLSFLSIRQPVVGELANDEIGAPLMTQLALPASSRDSSAKHPPIRRTLSPELPTPLKPELLARISWAKFIELIRIDDHWKRAFYENELLKANWSKRQLARQIGSLLYERTGLSTNKKAVIERARKQEPQETFADLIRDPYVLEFTGLAQRPEYLESDLESALLTHLQSFLLELGVGFCFEARQKRITVGRQHDYIDLVFYHRRLRCHVLIDLKIRPFKHGDAGQMNFYLNWWKAHGMEEGDAPPVGIILCSDRDQSAVEFATAGIDQKLFISRYLVALPSAEKLRAFLEADRDQIERVMVPSARNRTQPKSNLKSNKSSKAAKPRTKI
jgi:predicted nuclease of restriction endonuclease-like (RecB) superfamily